MQLKRYLPIFVLLLVAALLTACAAQPAAPTYVARLLCRSIGATNP